MSYKAIVHKSCVDLLEVKIDVIKKKTESIVNALQSETKNSAGDKHETSRAMLQLEREQSGQKIAEYKSYLEILNNINYQNLNTVVSLGSLVYTTHLNFYLAIPIGEIKIRNQNFYGISLKSPIGSLLLGKKSGDEISFRDQTFTILKIE